MNNLLSPQVQSEKLCLNKDFQVAILDKNFGKIKELINQTIRESYLDFAFSLLHEIEQDVKNNKRFDMNEIKSMRDKLQMTRLFKPL